jgi:hypothetical protein
MHQLILNTKITHFSTLFFCNEVLKYYTEEELSKAPWLVEHFDTYQTVVKKYAEK